ncbi:MAG: bifunctional YncE family protein/alkaline phosphatase family protein [Akkermansiaceae bacterium]|nr:bifunctional YncE family protein/alkaline phosphatase family protein [Armatimonadota bacterium]
MPHSPTRLLLPLFAGGALIAGAGYLASAPRLGAVKEGGYTVATGQRVRPAGDTLTYNGRPVDMVAAPDGKTLYLKDEKGLVCVDAATWKVSQKLPFPKEGGGSLHGLLVSRDGRTIWATGAGSSLWVVRVADDGQLAVERSIPLPGPTAGEKSAPSYPCGIAASADEKTLYVCLSRKNVLAVVDATAGTVTREIPTGVAPYDVVLSLDGATAWVSNWGGRLAKSGERTGDSSGTPVPVDERGVATSGSVSLLNLATGKEITQIETGLHASDLLLSVNGETLYVANANADTVSLIDTAKRSVRSTVIVKPDATLPFGSAPNALALSASGETLYVGCGGNNAVAAIDVSPAKEPTVRGWIPTAWYPGSLLIRNEQLYVACVKGYGSRHLPLKESDKRRSVYWVQGTVSRVPLAPLSGKLDAYTKQVLTDARVPEVLRSREKERSGRPPVPVPERTGEPSVFEHVVYIVKENRTYDQVFGDLKQGDGDPSLCLYGRGITPNHHALAEQFVLLDNFYCNGINSADGHSWVTEGNVTDHLEKAFGGFTRSYTFGDDALTYSSSGFVWDNVLAHGLSFRNWGEMAYTEPVPKRKYKEILADWQKRTGKTTFTSTIGIERLKQYTAPGTVGWNMEIPDVLRADLFLKDLARYEKEGGLPNLSLLYLPNDHTEGTTPGVPTPRSYMADNDLALGRVIEALSRSRFWAKTCVFVIEDDPQDGFDHVDGHRSICLVVSPYTRRKAVVSQFYNQTSVIHTMERMLGLPAMNQMDAAAPLMRDCFTPKPDFHPFVCQSARVPLAELNPPVSALSAPEKHWAKASLSLDFRQVDGAEEDTLNRILWHDAKGATISYPDRFAGAHGTGLAKRKLRASSVSGE